MDVEEAQFEASLLHTTDKWRPAPGGVSIGDSPNGTAGTFGCVVYKGLTPYILTSNHVIAGCNDTDIGADVCQPGPWEWDHDFCSNCTQRCEPLATLHSFVVIHFGFYNNIVDCALATPNDKADILHTVLNIGTIKEAKEATVDLAVKKMGRTTGLTTSTVWGWADVWVIYSKGSALFVDQIICDGKGGAAVQGGDSGSVVVDAATDEAVGLVMARSFDGEFYVANPAVDVADQLNVTFEPSPPMKARDTATGRVLTRTIEGIVYACETCCGAGDAYYGYYGYPMPSVPPSECCNDQSYGNCRCGTAQGRCAIPPGDCVHCDGYICQAGEEPIACDRPSCQCPESATTECGETGHCYWVLYSDYCGYCPSPSNYQGRECCYRYLWDDCD